MAVNLERFISNACCNSCQSFYDMYVEANVSFRSKLGMKAVIIRRQLGNCCDWCASLAGIYDPSNAPDDIYRRHSNCRCLVTYKTEEGYQNIWTKKIFKSQKDSRIERLKEIERSENYHSKFDIQKRILLSENKHIYDATEEWEANAKPDNVISKDLLQVRVNGKKYNVDGFHVIFDIKPHEKKVLEQFINKYGGLIEYHPRIVFPERISTPDCLYNGQRFDLKQPGLDNPGIKGDNVLFNIIYKKKEQAHCFVVDITRTGLTREEAIDQAIGLFHRDKTKFVEKIVLYDGEFFKVIEKI